MIRLCLHRVERSSFQFLRALAEPLQDLGITIIDPASGGATFTFLTLVSIGNRSPS
jgi:hypothetical protein